MIDLLDPFVGDREIYDLLSESQWWPADALLAYQREQLGRFLRYARSNVPFYADRLNAVLRSDGTVDWSRWSDVPILERTDLQERGDDLLTIALPPGHGPTSSIRSSGSSGKPILTHHSRLEGRTGRAVLLRSQLSHGIDYRASCLNLHGDDPAVAAWPKARHAGSWGPRWHEARGELWELNLLTPPAAVVEFIEQRKFRYLSGLPTRLEAVAYAAQEAGRKVSLDAIITRGQEVSAYQEGLFRETFSASTLSLYSTQEAGKLAHPCPECGTFHVNAEIALLEVVDAQGRSAPLGTEGEVVVTPFFNYAQPLIRYRLGDIAVAGDVCACGRGLPTLARISGRTYHMFTMASGQRFIPSISETLIAELGAGIWQLAQTGADQIELRFAPRVGVAVAPDAAFTEAALTALPAGFRVQVKRIPSFPLGGGGKHVLYLQEFNRNQPSTGTQPSPSPSHA